MPRSQYLGGGCFKAGYRVGRWVVKAADSHHKTYSTAVRLCRGNRIGTLGLVGIVPTTYVRTRNGRWMIQQYLKPLGIRESQRLDADVIALERAGRGIRLDLGCHNVGKDDQGRLWAFDW